MPTWKNCITIFLISLNFLSTSAFFKLSENCGRVLSGGSLSIGGEFSRKGQWPWLAPLFGAPKGNFFCGSSIISNRHLLSAAHCFHEKFDYRTKLPNQTFTILGRFNLSDTREFGSVKINALNIFIHHQWDPKSSSHDADISIVLLEKEIQFNTIIQPVCLPSGNENVNSLKGFVAGYGYSDVNGNVIKKSTNIPKYIEISSKDHLECIYLDPDLARYGSKRMFCAGEQGKNPCSGDSGSGFYNKENGIWKVLGIVSTTTTAECEESKFVLFTNIFKFKDWIEEKTSHINNVAQLSNHQNPIQAHKSSSLRISEKKCEEYSKLTKLEYLVSPLSFGTASRITQESEDYKCVKATSLIVGGVKTKLGEFPHMAAIGWDEISEIHFGASGSLISENFVLTSAQVYFQRGNPKNWPSIVRLGDLDLRSEDDGAKGIDILIQKFIVHEKFDKTMKKNDIGLIKLVNSVFFTANIRPACFWQRSHIPTRFATATGYGKTVYYSPNSDELLKVQLNMIENKNCKKFSINIDSSQLCAGGDEKGTCSGDSGGPLQIQYGSNKCTYYIIGITSYGSSYCGYSSSVYTKVSSFIDWIESKVWDSTVNET